MLHIGERSKRIRGSGVGREHGVLAEALRRSHAVNWSLDVNQTIILIRHAEKPGGEWPGPGFTEDGTEDPESLVIRG